VRQRIRRREDDERPDRRRRALRDFEEREWDEELRHVTDPDDDIDEHEDRVPAGPDETGMDDEDSSS
jgi:hypothetical protein